MATMQKGADLTEYFYDSENHLTRVKKNSAVVEDYEYDGDGGRTKKLPNGSAPATKFVGGMYEEQGTRQTSYIFLGDQRIASVTNGAVLYFHADHLGSANLVVDSSGVLKELSEYEPYGRFSKHEKYGTADEEARHYFTNQYLDEATDLYYYGARYYNPLIGRFLTPDTIVQSPGNPQTFNRYSYCGNNPINRVDPSGHSWGSFLRSFVSAAAFVVLTPFVGPIAAGAIVGGISGGITSNGWSWQGALTGAIIGGVSGWAFGSNGTNGFLGEAGVKVGLGILAAGAVYSGVKGGWSGLSDYASGVAGAVVGAGFGSGINKSISRARTPKSAELNSGTQKTVGNEPNTPTRSLDLNKGAEAVERQALKSQYTYDPQTKVIKGYVHDGIELPQPQGTTKMRITIDDLLIEEYIPNGWNVGPTQNGKGILFTDPNSNASIRIMGRTNIYSNS